MIEAYSKNLTVVAGQAIPFNSTSLKKGCTAELLSPTTIALEKCGVYMVARGCSAAATETIQLYRDGVALPEATRTGTSPSFVTLVQVGRNNEPCCPCSSPVTIQLVSVLAATLTDASITVTKVA